jgi:hypothetical protein
VEIPDIGYTNSIGSGENFYDKKKVMTSIIFTSISLHTPNFIILVLWTSRDQISLDFLSKSQMVV